MTSNNTQYRYRITYSTRDGLGRVEVTRPAPIRTEADASQLEANLAHQLGRPGLSIIGWSRYDD